MVQKKEKQIIKGKKPQLIAPAGNLEKLKTAFAFGADAVYAGIPDFSLRVRINDFDLESLEEAVVYAHARKKKIFITLNILAHNRHLAELPAFLKVLKMIKPDGLIISDPGVMSAVKKYWPEARIHLSTQANCTNWQAARFWRSQGVRRIVLGREVTLEEMREIKKKNPSLELEAFVHGAMCMAYSGRCFLSKFFTGRSANLGDCVQSCRWKYEVRPAESLFIRPQGREEVLEVVEEEHGSYLLNSQDLCLLERLPDLIAAGIGHLKIEGRAKSVYYLATVVGAYRKAIDALYDEEMSPARKKSLARSLKRELEEKLNHRGYTEGFAFGQGHLAQNLNDSHQGSAWEFCGQVIGAQEQKNKKTKKRYLISVKVHNTLKAGEPIEIILPGYGIIKMEMKEMRAGSNGERLSEAHGGQNQEIIFESPREIPPFSILRRKLK